MTREPRVGDKIKMKDNLGSYSNLVGEIIGTVPGSNDFKVMLYKLGTERTFIIWKIRFVVIIKDLYQYNI